jgi:hypothetical protein
LPDDQYEAGLDRTRRYRPLPRSQITPHRRARANASCSIRSVVTNFVALSDPPHPIQHLDKWLVAGAPGSFRQLAYCEVRLLLAGALLAEGNTPDLYYRRTWARTCRPATYLTPS